MPSIKEIIGGGYDEFWNFKGRYRLVKGGRGSKKSTTTAIWYIYNMMYYFYKYDVKPNVLVIRAFKVDHLDTTFAQLQWAINKLGVDSLWDSCRNPMSFTFKPSGQKILFRGMDKAERIKSITSAVGHLCWVWWEEAFEIPYYEDVETINLSIRGELPEPLFYQNTFTFNPSVSAHWLKKRFYDHVDPETGLSNDGAILAITRNFDCNEFLDENFKMEMDRLKRLDPDRYRIVAMGEWGTNGGLIYTNWKVLDFDYTAPLSYEWEWRYGIDFGFMESPTAIVCLAVNKKMRLLYVMDTSYIYHKVAPEIAEECRRMGIADKHIIGDSSHMMAIEEMSRNGIRHIEPCTKGAGSIVVGIERVREYKIIIERHNQQFIREISNYRWKKSKKEDCFADEPDAYQEDHGLDAMRYALSIDSLFDSKYAMNLQRRANLRSRRDRDAEDD